MEKRSPEGSIRAIYIYAAGAGGALIPLFWSWGTESISWTLGSLCVAAALLALAEGYAMWNLRGRRNESKTSTLLIFTTLFAIVVLVTLREFRLMSFDRRYLYAPALVFFVVVLFAAWLTEQKKGVLVYIQTAGIAFVPKTT